MCGVFGFVSYNGRGPNLKRLEMMARDTEKRDPDAFGFSWIDGLGRLRMFKQTGRISDNLGLLALASDARMLIGHCRWATHGSPAENINNHPHPADGGWFVHNGVVRDHASIALHEGFQPVTPCDSEVLGLLIEARPGSMLQRCKAAARMADNGPLVLLGLWSRPNRLIAVRAGNPLSISICKNWSYYIASRPNAKPGNTDEITDGSAMQFTGRRLNRKAQPVGA